MDADERVPDESSAYHEVGHAVAAVVLNFGVESVTLRECRIPSIRFRDMFVRPSLEQARREAVLGLAGVIAQDIFLGVADPTARARQSCDAILAGAKYPSKEDWQREDYGRVMVRLRSACDRDDTRTRQAAHAAIDETQALLQDRWEAVKELAGALWSGHALVGADVERALGRPSV
jgi:hypothetical protein